MTEAGLMRHCKSCGLGKPMAQFIYGQTSRMVCKTCYNAKKRAKYFEKVGGLKPVRQKPTEQQRKKMQALHSQRWRERNPEKAREAGKKWSSKNKERRNEKFRRRYKEKKADMLAYNSVKRSKLRQATPAWCELFIVSEAYRLARLRSQITGIKWSVDHIVPIVSDIVCGLHVHTNIRVVPAVVNSSKGNRWWPDMP